MNYRTDATVLDKALLFPHLILVLGADIYRLLTSPFSTGPKPKQKFKDFAYAAFRQNFRSINAAQEQVLFPSTETVYRQLAKKEKFQTESTVLHSAKLHWLGPKSSKQIILYIHGGGYALSCPEANLQWVYNLQKGTGVTVVFLEYTISPKGKYPRQMQEAAEAVRYLLDEQKRQPRDIVVMGDSAGGNLTLALISHILHPHPEVQKVSLSQPFASTILVSPWVDLEGKDDSVRRNATSDMLTANIIERWGKMFLGEAPLDNYNNPIFTDAKWWSGLDKVVGQVHVWGGGGELLIDSIRKITETLKAAQPQTDIVVEDGAGHEAFIFDVLFQYPGKAEATALIESWVAQSW